MCDVPSLAPLELEPDDLPEVVLAAAADDAGVLLRGDGDGVAGGDALHRRGPHHVRVEQVLCSMNGRLQGWGCYVYEACYGYGQVMGIQNDL